MTRANREQYDAARHGHARLAHMLYPRVIAMRADPTHLLRDLEQQGSLADVSVLADAEYRAWTSLSFAEAVGRSVDGWASDNMALTRPWGFDPARITVPTLLWHGVRDVFSPVAHAQWLATRISTALLHLVEDTAHLSAAAAQSEAIRWLVHGGAFPRACGVCTVTPC
jgi:pimeloyl-ACP methyl ester carboxylesterase